MPSSPEPFSGAVDSLPLEQGALVYALVHTDAARPILDLIPIEGISEKDTRMILDRIDSFAAAIYPADSGCRFRIAAWGKITASQGRFIFGMNKGWKKMRGAGYSYWYSKNNAMSVALGKKQAFISQSLSGPAEPRSNSPGFEIPDACADFFQGAAVFCWIDDPGLRFDRIFEEMDLELKLPAEYVYISLFPLDETETAESLDTPDSTANYEAQLRIQCPDENQALALARLISIARLFSAGISNADTFGTLAGLLLANAPVQDGRFLLISPPPMSDREIAILINAFLVYLKTNNP